MSGTSKGRIFNEGLATVLAAITTLFIENKRMRMN